MMGEVFRTNVEEEQQAEKIRNLLLQHFPSLNVSFDLEDCDKVLRIKGDQIVTSAIARLVADCGFACNELI